MSDLGNKEIFAKNLKYYMALNKKDRIDVCRDLEIPYTTFAEWYNARIYPRIDKIQLLANYFDIKKSDLVENKEKFDKSITGVPKKNEGSAVIFVYGTIPAGVPLECIEDVIDTEEIPVDMLKGGKEYFALKIKGDSMEPDYLDGDIIILQRKEDCENGEDCCVMVNGSEGTFKRVFKTENGIVLQPLNNKYQPMIFSNEQILNLPVRILGVFEELRRRKGKK